MDPEGEHPGEGERDMQVPGQVLSGWGKLGRGRVPGERRVWCALLLAVWAAVGVWVAASGPALAQREDPIDIYFFAGGPPGDPFATIVYNGARHAAEILGDRVRVRYVFSDWNPDTMVRHFQEAVAARPDGIAVMGHPGVDALRPFVEEAIRLGIIVTSQNVTLPELQERYADRGFGYVGQDLYGSGYMLGKAAVQRAGLKAGDRAMVWGLLRLPQRGLRTRGVIDALREAGVVVDYIEISPEVDADAAAGIPVFVGYVERNPDVRLVVTDHGALTATLPIYLEAAGLRPGQVYAAGFDVSPTTLAGIRQGYIGVVHSQQPFLQGFLPIFQIYLTKRFGISGLHIDTGVGLIDANNVERLAPLVEQGLAGAR